MSQSEFTVDHLVGLIDAAIAALKLATRAQHETKGWREIPEIQEARKEFQVVASQFIHGTAQAGLCTEGAALDAALSLLRSAHDLMDTETCYDDAERKGTEQQIVQAVSALFVDVESMMQNAGQWMRLERAKNKRALHKRRDALLNDTTPEGRAEYDRLTDELAGCVSGEFMGLSVEDRRILMLIGIGDIIKADPDLYAKIRAAMAPRQENDA